MRHVFRLLDDSIRRGRPVPWVLLENVEALLDRHGDTPPAVHFVTSALEALGYHSWAQRTICSAAFGVPNRRKRVFIVASWHGDARDVILAQVRAARAVRCMLCVLRWFARILMGALLACAVMFCDFLCGGVLWSRAESAPEAAWEEVDGERKGRSNAFQPTEFPTYRSFFRAQFLGTACVDSAQYWVGLRQGVVFLSYQA